MENLLPLIVVILVFVLFNFFVKKNYKLRIVLLSISVLVLFISSFLDDTSNKYVGLLFSLIGGIYIYRLIKNRERENNK